MEYTSASTHVEPSTFFLLLTQDRLVVTSFVANYDIEILARSWQYIKSQQRRLPSDYSDEFFALTLLSNEHSTMFFC